MLAIETDWVMKNPIPISPAMDQSILSLRYRYRM